MVKRCLYILALFLLFGGSVSAWDAPPSAVPGKYSDLIQQIALSYGINPRFAQALIWRESRFNRNATGSKNEIGLTQIRMCTVQDWAKANNCRIPDEQELYGAELNLTIGLWRLDLALKHWDGCEEQVKLALLEYNMGRTALLRAIAHCNGDLDTLFTRCSGSAKYAEQIIAKYNEYLQMDQEIISVAQQ